MTDRRAVEHSVRLRAEIRAMLEAHPPLRSPLTAKEIRQRLKWSHAPSLRTVQWHMAAIRLEAELAALSDDSLRSAQFIK
ncbi:MAG TPA: hypothetical protein VMU40_07700 [Steroidobacteraceae bacterium]|nr:hypothetical protein [Steroidobacteraceae bacterium]